MVNFFPGFLTCSQSASLSALIDHIVNLTRKIGAEHVGLGSDFDGIPEVPGGMEGVEKFPALVAGLLEAGLSAKEVGMIVGGNLIRVWKEVERIGKKLREQGARVEEEPEGMGTRKYRCPNSTHVAVDEFDGLEF